MASASSAVIVSILVALGATLRSLKAQAARTAAKTKHEAI
jgi:hypothetical protein